LIFPIHVKWNLYKIKKKSKKQLIVLESIYITVKLANGINAEEFLRWSLKEYDGPICTFVPLVTTSGSFYTEQEKDFHRDELRLCLGLPEDQIQEAIKAFADQLRAFINCS